MRTWITAALLFAATPALAAPFCPTESDRAELGAFSERLASAKSPEKAKKMALSKIHLGKRAIDAASAVVDDAGGVAHARARLDALEQAVVGAEDQRAVAAAFGSLDQQAVRCDYDTMEIAIIVIGFILGIIPGIIFLFLFC